LDLEWAVVGALSYMPGQAQKL